MNNVKVSAFLFLVTIVVNVLAKRMKLYACLGPYPGTNSTIEGGIKVTFGNKPGWLKYSYDMKKLEPHAIGDAHIHTGTSCTDDSLVGGHYWNHNGNYTAFPDPWTMDDGAFYRTNKKGRARGKFFLYNGYTYAETHMHAVVIHSLNGARIGCGTLRKRASTKCSFYKKRRGSKAKRRH